jgi:hypothetical protein
MKQPPQQKPGRSKQDYATPSIFIAAVKARLGIRAFTIDFAADATNAKAERYIDEATDALSVDWSGQVVPGEWAWLNPPFADIRAVGPEVSGATRGRRTGGLSRAGVDRRELVP